MRKLLLASAILACLAIVTVVQSQDRTASPDQPGQAQPGSGPAAAAPEADNYRQQVSYALGRNFAHNLRENQIEVDPQSLIAGIQDLLSGAQPRWTDEQLESTLQRFGQEMQQRAATRFQQQAAKNEQQAQQFLAENAQREGVETTASGLQYRVLREGDGPSPTLDDVVRCTYRGVLLNGTEFDNSARHGGPVEFPVDGVIPGWTEALQEMQVGDRWQLFVPGDLAYGMNPPGPPIEPNSLLVFEIELVEIVQQP